MPKKPALHPYVQGAKDDARKLLKEVSRFCPEFKLANAYECVARMNNARDWNTFVADGGYDGHGRRLFERFLNELYAPVFKKYAQSIACDFSFQGMGDRIWLMPDTDLEAWKATGSVCRPDESCCLAIDLKITSSYVSLFESKIHCRLSEEELPDVVRLFAEEEWGDRDMTLERDAPDNYFLVLPFTGTSEGLEAPIADYLSGSVQLLMAKPNIKRWLMRFNEVRELFAAYLATGDYSKLYETIKVLFSGGAAETHDLDPEVFYVSTVGGIRFEGMIYLDALAIMARSKDRGGFADLIGGGIRFFDQSGDKEGVMLQRDPAGYYLGRVETNFERKSLLEGFTHDHAKTLAGEFGLHFEGRQVPFEETPAYAGLKHWVKHNPGKASLFDKFGYITVFPDWFEKTTA